LREVKKVNFFNKQFYCRCCKAPPKVYGDPLINIAVENSGSFYIRQSSESTCREVHLLTAWSATTFQQQIVFRRAGVGVEGDNWVKSVAYSFTMANGAVRIVSGSSDKTVQV
jgi:hypothetical protein